MDQIQQVKRFLDDHEEKDNARFGEVTDALEKIHKSLDSVHVRLGGMEKTLEDQDNKLELLMRLYNGFQFGRAAILWTAGIVGGLSVIIGSLLTLIRFVK